MLLLVFRETGLAAAAKAMQIVTKNQTRKGDRATYAMTMTAAAARPARAKEPALALAAPVQIAGLTEVELVVQMPVEAGATGVEELAGHHGVSVEMGETGVLLLTTVVQSLQVSEEVAVLMGSTGVLLPVTVVQSLHVSSDEVEVLMGSTGVLLLVMVVQSPQLSVEVVEVLMGSTGMLLVVVQSPQLGSEEVVVLIGATGMLLVVVQSPQVSVDLYGQSVTVGSQEVMVTSTVSVRVWVLAEATAMMPAAMAMEARIFAGEEVGVG